VAASTSARLSLRGLVTVTVTAMWFAAGAASLVTGDVQPFVIATGPFGLVCGAILGVGIIRKQDGS
jgi:hypothetical protein